MKKFLFFVFTLLAPLFAMAQSSQLSQCVVFQVTSKATTTTNGEKRYVTYDLVGDEANLATVKIGNKSVATDSEGVAIFTLPSGIYNYTVSSKSHRNSSGTIEVRGEKVVKRVELIPMFGWLTISYSNMPRSVRIYIDSTHLCDAPFDDKEICKVSSGTHTVRIEHEDYKPFVKTVTICDLRTLNLTPTLTPRKGTLNVTSSPASADVYVDENLIGQTPLMVDFIIGEHSVKVSKSGFKSDVRSVNVSEGGVTNVNAVLTAEGHDNVKIGDVITINGVKGVVFEVSADGKHGKAVSVSQAPDYMTWSAAKAWCRNLGSGWYLPTEKELVLIYKNKAAVNSTLATVVGKVLDDSYWSSTGCEETYADIVSMDNGAGYSISQGELAYVRAVSTF